MLRNRVCITKRVRHGGRSLLLRIRIPSSVTQLFGRYLHLFLARTMRAGCSVVLLLGLLALIRADPGLSDTSNDSKKEGLAEPSNDTDFSTGGLSTSTDSVNNKDTGEKDPVNASSSTSDCNQYCSLSYPPHTYPQVCEVHVSQIVNTLLECFVH